MLIHDGNTHVERVTRAIKVYHFAVHMNRTFVRTKVSAKHIHQCTLSRTIFTTQCMYLTRGERHADILQGLYAREGFTYVPDFNSGRVHLKLESRINELVCADA